MDNLLVKITNYLMKWAEKRGRVFKITGTAGPDDVYLIRYYIIKSPYFNFFIHQFLRSDRDDLHDHPWDFCTYLVSGAYTENKYNPQTGQVEATRRENKEYEYLTDDFMTGYAHIKENVFVFRKATDQHQVVVDRDLKEHQKDLAATTLFFSGPTKREWGFIKEEPLKGVEKISAEIEHDMYFGNTRKFKGTKRVWVKWTTYLGLPENTKSRG